MPQEGARLIALPAPVRGMASFPVRAVAVWDTSDRAAAQIRPGRHRHWARITHAPALASTAGIELAAVWGRNAEAAAALADSYHCGWYDNFDDFLAGVDAVAFAVPPDVQAELAVRAARAGRHLLLEKPIATTERGRGRLGASGAGRGVASVGVLHSTVPG